MESITIIINYKSFKHLILVIIINYNCQKIIIIIRYNRLLTPKLGSGDVFVAEYFNGTFWRRDIKKKISINPAFSQQTSEMQHAENSELSMFINSKKRDVILQNWIIDQQKSASSYLPP